MREGIHTYRQTDTLIAIPRSHAGDGENTSFVLLLLIQTLIDECLMSLVDGKDLSDM